MLVLKRWEYTFGNLAVQLSGEVIGESENHLIIFEVVVVGRLTRY